MGASSNTASDPCNCGVTPPTFIATVRPVGTMNVPLSGTGRGAPVTPSPTESFAVGVCRSRAKRQLRPAGPIPWGSGPSPPPQTRDWYRNTRERTDESTHRNRPERDDTASTGRRRPPAVRRRVATDRSRWRRNDARRPRRPRLGHGTATVGTISTAVPAFTAFTCRCWRPRNYSTRTRRRDRFASVSPGP